MSESAVQATERFEVPTSSGGRGWSATIGGVRVAFGRGSIERLGDLVRELQVERVLLVSDPGLTRAGHVGRVVDHLTSHGLDVATFDQIPQQPGESDVARGVEVARSHDPQGLIALGGGSAMDAAKGVNFALTNGGPMERYWGYGKATQPLLPSIGVPTTAGTGSEAQSYALITQNGTGRKMACGDPGAKFRSAVLDADLLSSAPPEVAAAAGIDAVAHAVESYVTRTANPISRMLARQSFLLLQESFASTDAQLGKRLLGAHLAGAAIEASMLGAAHAAANPLSASYGIVHGQAVGVLLPTVVRWNADFVEDDYRSLDPDGSASLAHWIEGVRRTLGLPERLSDLGVKKEDLPALAEAATQEWTGQHNPRELTAGDFEEIYRAVY